MEQSLKFEETKNHVDKLLRVDKLLKEVTVVFLQSHYISLNRAVSTYGALRDVYKDKSRDLSFYVGFREAFFQFYAIRFVSNQFREDFYKKMVEVRNQKEYNIETLVEELKDKDKNKFQFSFATKLLNIMDDSRYPIYDSRVAKAFGLHYVAKDTDEEKITQYVYHYELITKTYLVLLEKHQDKIKYFKSVFKGANTLSDMRIIDMIVWKKGELMMKK